MGGLLRLMDVSIVGILGLGIYFLYVYPSQADFGRYLATVIIAVLVTSAMFQWFGVYSGDFVFSRRLRIDRMLSAWAITCCVLLAIAFALKISGSYSRLWALTWFVATFGALTVGRLVLGHWITQLSRAGRFANRTVIVGAGPQGQRLAGYLNRNGDVRTRIIGFIDDRRDRVPSDSNGYEILGDSGHLIQLIRSNLVDQVFVALPWSADDRLRELVHKLAMTPITIRLAPDSAGFDFTDRTFTQVAGLPMLHLFDRPISGWSQVTKTVEDRALAALFLLFLGPLMAMVALAIKIDSPGPAIFRQQRYGFNGKLIEVWKFRTMHHHLRDDNAAVSVTRNDRRVTRLGAFLRRTSLDELPQLFNVIKGEMSLVGPRPHAIETKAAGYACEEVVDAYAARHKVKPGITGWAQVNGWRGELDRVDKIEKRVEYDLYYIDNWSVWLDLVILAKTAFVVFGDDNAY